MSFQYNINYKSIPNIGYILESARLDEDNNFLVLEYSNGEVIRLALTDLIGHET